MTSHNLTSNMEDYLEAILTLQEEQKVARVRDIARQLKVKMPSVTGAVRNLAEKGLVNYERYSFVTLT
ncbi:MAG: metal-dependent transcriptional regulator, partial [Deltaproteobacteria bacterium]|nr:metal-dependent transcriptional regulator [Deltaproteobacteria bacterium]